MSPTATAGQGPGLGGDTGPGRAPPSVIAGTGAGCHREPVQRDGAPGGAAAARLHPLKVRGQPRDGLGTPGVGAGVRSSGGGEEDPGTRLCCHYPG